MNSGVTGVSEENGRVVGVETKTADGPLRIRAALTVGADGRHSIVRERAGLQIMDLGAPMDVLWMRIRRHAGDPEQTLGHVESGKIFIMINREDYWQCAFIIPKGAADEIRQRGIEQFRNNIVLSLIHIFLRVHPQPPVCIELINQMVSS